MDKNHSGKCVHLKKGKKWKERNGGISAECLLPGFYYCVTGGRFWSERPKFDFDVCEDFAKNKSQIKK